MLLCNACVDNNERDNFIRCRARTVSKNSKLGEKLQKFEEKTQEIVDEKVNDALKKTPGNFTI